MLPVTATPNVQMPSPVQGPAVTAMPNPSAAGVLPFNAVPPSVANVRTEDKPHQPFRAQPRESVEPQPAAANKPRTGAFAQGAFRDSGGALRPLPSSGFLAQVLAQVGEKVGLESLRFSFPITDYETLLSAPRQAGSAVLPGSSALPVRETGGRSPETIPVKTVETSRQDAIRLPDSSLHSVKFNSLNFLTTLSQSGGNLMMSSANGTAAYHYGYQKVSYTPHSQRDERRNGSVSPSLTINAYLSAFSLADNRRTAAI